MPSLQKVLQAAVGPAFEIGRELPGAGMSRVFLAKEPALGREVVVKVLPPDLVSTTSLHRFTREIQVTAGLQHPHILPVITAGGTDDLRFYVTPFIRGESLRARLASGEPMSFAESVRIGDQLLTAIAFAHGRGVIHRDVKPGNVLLSEGHAILADFGIAGIVESGHAADHPDQLTGSTLDSARIYLAPENPHDEQRDLFAAAVVIHEMAAGVAGTPGLAPAAITAAIRSRHPRAAVSDVRKLATILSRALAVDPTARFHSASELRGAIHAIGRGSRRPMLVGIGVGGVAALLALSTFAWRPSPAPIATPTSAPEDLNDGPAATEVVAPPPAATPVLQGKTTSPASPAAAPIVIAPIDSAEMLFRRGDFGGAATLYNRVAADDATDSRAQLGVAITSGLMTAPAELEAARIAADRALTGKPALGAHDRAIAEGFIALADRRFPDACAAFERAREVQGTFEAWMGLGECLIRDEAIVMDSAGTPQFRAGYSTAFNAFANAARAAGRTPPALVYRRLVQTVPQTSSDARMGRTPDNRIFAGNWKIIGDTLGFVVAQSGPRAMNPQVFVDAAEAARLGRDRLRPLLLSWIKRAPDEAQAYEMLAVNLENSGIISEVGDDRISALTAITRARERETIPANAFRLATIHARLLLRARRYEALANLADSLLAANADDQTQAEALMPLALLTGRIELATSLLSRISGTTSRVIRGADGRPVALPATTLAERADFVVRAVLGVCDERVKAAPARMIHLLDATFPAGVPRGVEPAFVERPALFALPCLGPAVTTVMREPGRQLPNWARAFDASDTAFPAEYAAMVRARPEFPRGAEATLDGVMVDVLVKLAVKDSAGALKTLTLDLDRIPMMGRGGLSSEWGSGSIGRGMAIAAELAAARGERETANRWGNAVVTLWRNADPELKPRVDRIRAALRATSSGRSPE